MLNKNHEIWNLLRFDTKLGSLREKLYKSSANDVVHVNMDWETDERVDIMLKIAKYVVGTSVRAQCENNKMWSIYIGKYYKNTIW